MHLNFNQKKNCYLKENGFKIQLSGHFDTRFWVGFITPSDGSWLERVQLPREIPTRV